MMLKRVMLGLACAAAIGVGSLAMSSTAEAGGCYRGGFGGGYYGGFAPTYGYGYHVGYRGYRAPARFHRHYHVAPVPYHYYGGYRGYGGYGRGVHLRVGF